MWRINSDIYETIEKGWKQLIIFSSNLSAGYFSSIHQLVHKIWVFIIKIHLQIACFIRPAVQNRKTHIWKTSLEAAKVLPTHQLINWQLYKNNSNHRKNNPKTRAAVSYEHEQREMDVSWSYRALYSCCAVMFTHLNGNDGRLVWTFGVKSTEAQF